MFLVYITMLYFKQIKIYKILWAGLDGKVSVGKHEHTGCDLVCGNWEVCTRGGYLQRISLRRFVSQSSLKSQCRDRSPLRQIVLVSLNPALNYHLERSP